MIFYAQNALIILKPDAQPALQMLNLVQDYQVLANVRLNIFEVVPLKRVSCVLVYALAVQP